jgi:hypothetical protein
MTDSDYKRSMWLIALFLTIASAIIMGSIMPTSKTVTQITEKKVVYTQERKTTYGPSKEFDDVCQGWPGEVMTAVSFKFDSEYTTFLTLRPVGDSYVVPCQVQGDWTKEFTKGKVISIPNGKVSG